MKIKPTIVYYCDTDVVHTSYVYAGLISLKQKGLIDLKYKFSSPGSLDSGVSEFSSLIDVYFKDKKIKSINFDFHDYDRHIDKSRLEYADEYYKVNYNSEYIESEFKESTHKIHKFLPYWIMRAEKEEAVLSRILSPFYLRYQKYGFSKYNFFSKSGLSQIAGVTYSKYKRYLSRLPLGQYNGTNTPKKEVVFYSPGCWTEGHERNIKENDLRANIIRTLRKEFGSKFIGGFPQNEISLKKYPDCIFQGKMTHLDYINHLKTSSVAIYSNGVNRDCITWRLGEYLAAGNVIVGESLTRELAIDFEKNNCFLPFNSIEDCVGVVSNLLVNNDKLNDRNKHISNIYNTLVEPSVALQKIIFN